MIFPCLTRSMRICSKRPRIQNRENQLECMHCVKVYARNQPKIYVKTPILVLVTSCHLFTQDLSVLEKINE